jgi:WD40 repeat protein
VATLTGHGDLVFSSAWSPDGRRIVTASADKTLRIWEVSSGMLLSTLVGHDDAVFGCAWSPDGSRIASASLDSTLRIWEVSTGACWRP